MPKLMPKCCFESGDGYYYVDITILRRRRVDRDRSCGLGSSPLIAIGESISLIQ
jgi:hypothetical protein